MLALNRKAASRSPGPARSRLSRARATCSRSRARSSRWSGSQLGGSKTGSTLRHRPGRKLSASAGRPRVRTLSRAAPPPRRLPLCATSLVPLTGGIADLDPLLELVGDARFVLLGEASHGTHEFYRERAADHQAADRGEGLHARWPSRPTGPTPTASTATCAGAATTPTPRRRWAASGASRPGCGATPTCSTSSAGCARTTTAGAASGQVGFYGLDLYSLHARSRRCSTTSTRSIPRRPRRARERYACFDHFGEDPQALRLRGRVRARRRRARSEVVAQLVELQRAGAATTCAATASRPRTSFLRRAERPAWSRTRSEYYRTMFAGRRLVLEPARPAHGRDARRAARPPRARSAARPRVVVWAHNSHLGDARATEMGEQRRAQPRPARARAARRATRVSSASPPTRARSPRPPTGAAPAERKRVRPALPGSYEALFHDVGIDRRSCSRLRDGGRPRRLLREPRLERAIGVIYRPRDRAAQPLLSRRPARSSTRSCTSTRRARSSRSSRRPVGSWRAARDLSDGGLSDRSSG